MEGVEIKVNDRFVDLDEDIVQCIGITEEDFEFAVIEISEKSVYQIGYEFSVSKKSKLFYLNYLRKITK